MFFAIDGVDYRGFVLSPTGGAAPAAPANLQAVNPIANGIRANTSGSTNTVNLTWQPKSINETGFLVQREVGASGVWENVEMTGASVEAYSDNTVQPNTTYSYRVTATNTYGSSGPSNQATATTGSTSISLVSVAFAPLSVTAGTATTATITLSSPAPNGGANVDVTFDGVVLGYLQVAAGATTATYVPTTSTLLAGTHVLSGYYNGVTKSGSLSVTIDPTLPT